jgi:hypothetical protein
VANYSEGWKGKMCNMGQMDKNGQFGHMGEINQMSQMGGHV